MKFERLLGLWYDLQALPVGTVVRVHTGEVMRKTSDESPGNVWRDKDWWEGELGQFPSETLVDFGPIIEVLATPIGEPT